MVLLASNHLKPKINSNKEKVPVVITRACLGTPFGKDALEHLEYGRRLDLSPLEAYQLLVVCASGYFVDQWDDPHTDKSLTLTKERAHTIECQTKLNNEHAQELAENAEIRKIARRKLLEGSALVV